MKFMILKINKDEINLNNVNLTNSTCFFNVYNLFLLLYKKHLFNDLIFNIFNRIIRLFF